MMNLDLLALARAGSRNALNEMEGKALLAGYGVNVPRSVRVADASEVDRRIADKTPPFALKVLSDDILHKSDAGGVRLNLVDAASIKSAIEKMKALPTIDADTIDGAVIFGTGWAPFRGGPLHYAKTRRDVPRVLEQLADRHGPRFTPDPGWGDIA